MQAYWSLAVVGTLYLSTATDSLTSITEDDLSSDIHKQVDIKDAAEQYELGIKYMKGDGVAPIKSKAIKWLTLAAEQGHFQAQLELTNVYENYNPSDPLEIKQAAKWLTQAAELGQAKAQFLLGNMYALGRGVIQDYKQAAEWLQKAANAGHIEAMVNLGMMHVDGSGVPKDRIKAYVWLNLAAAEGNHQAFIARSEVSKLLNTEQLSEAQARSREWKPSAQSTGENNR